MSSKTNGILLWRGFLKNSHTEFEHSIFNTFYTRYNEWIRYKHLRYSVMEFIVKVCLMDEDTDGSLNNLPVFKLCA